MFNLLPTKRTQRQVRKKMAAVVVTPQRVTTIRVAKAALRKPVSDRILAQRADRRQPIRGVASTGKAMRNMAGLRRVLRTGALAQTPTIDTSERCP